MGVYEKLLAVQSELQAALGIDLFHGNFHTCLDSSAVNSSAAGQGAGAADDVLGVLRGVTLLAASGKHGDNHDHSQHQC